jgi:hypothetical protein
VRIHGSGDRSRAPSVESTTSTKEHTMETATRIQHHVAATAVAGLVGLTALLLAAPAQAYRIPADPMTFVGTPVGLSQLVNDSHAANVWSALEDLRTGR